MNRNRFIVIFTIGLSLLLPTPGCGDESATGTGASADNISTLDARRDVLILDDTFDHSSMEVNVGVTIELVLEGNPTTGYEWIVEADGAPVMKQKGEPDFEPESDLIGAPGIFTWRFEVVEAGTAELKLVYSRPGDEEAQPEDKFQISVIAK